MNIISELMDNAVAAIGLMNERMDDPVSWILLGIIVALARITA